MDVGRDREGKLRWSSHVRGLRNEVAVRRRRNGVVMIKEDEPWEKGSRRRNRSKVIGEPQRLAAELTLWLRWQLIGIVTQSRSATRWAGKV